MKVLDKPHICEMCGKEYTVDFRKDRQSLKTPSRFCGLSCKNSYSTSKIVDKTKKAVCQKCGETFYVSIHRSLKNFICENCKMDEKSDRKTELRKLMEEKKAIIDSLDKGDRDRQKLNRRNQIDEEIRKLTYKPCKYCGRPMAPFNLEKHERSCSNNPNQSHKKTGKLRKDVREGYIYKVTNNLNGKFYIGKHRGLPEKSKNYYGSGIAIVRAINKYGKENFTKEVLFYTKDGDLNEMERYYIERYDAYNSEKGYNMTKGGDGGNFIGHKHTDETKRKISESGKKARATNI